MIRRLRGKFILINMTIVTIMICVILGLVYHFTKENIEANSINMMQNIAARPIQMDTPGKSEDEIRLPYFTLQIEPDGELMTTGGGYYDLSDQDFLDHLIKDVVESGQMLGIIEEYNLRFYHMPSPRFQRFVFVDISNELATLKGLMRICFLIGIVSFLVFLWFSMILSRWAVKPVELAWKHQRQFAADASHELKTPLTVIMTNAELMQSPEYDEADKTDYLAGILSMSKQMRRLIEQMLELARTDSIQKKPDLRPVDYSKLVYDAVLPFEPVFFEKGLELITDIEADIRVKGAESQLRQIVEILLDNAGKYGKAFGMVWITLKKQGKRHCVLTVANEGEAIPPEELKHIFKRFYRADKARSRNGSFGLGLSIAENIVMQHKGKIWAESKNGINSFHIKLPVLSVSFQGLPLQ